jgi:hypothetical protein
MTLPLWIYIVLIPFYGLMELAILVRNRAFFTPRKRDRTTLGVVIPFMLFIALGVPILLSAWLTFILTVLTAIGILARIRKEERFMREQFPGYEEYARRTWRLLPGIY